MGLTYNQKQLIEYVAKNDIRGARAAAIACVVEDETAKNKIWCDCWEHTLRNNKAFIELPAAMQDLAFLEDVTETFREERYLLTPREEEIFKTIVRMHKVSSKMLNLGISYLNTTLLYGESGTGKTMFGRYVAKKLGLPFCYLNFSKVVDSALGTTSKNIAKAFDYAISNPCVFMLDEIDCISVRRADASHSGAEAEMARVTISLLQSFDRLTNEVIVIGATNRRDRIDEAIFRRFSVAHEMSAITEEEKNALAHKYLTDVGYMLPEKVIADIAYDSSTPSDLINEIIKRIAEQISDEIDNEGVEV